MIPSMRVSSLLVRDLRAISTRVALDGSQGAAGPMVTVPAQLRLGHDLERDAGAAKCETST